MRTEQKGADRDAEEGAEEKADKQGGKVEMHDVARVK